MNMLINEVRCNVEVDVIDSDGTKATFQFSGFHEEGVKSMIHDFSGRKPRNTLLDLHQYLLTRCNSNQQTVNIIFKNKPVI